MQCTVLSCTPGLRYQTSISARYGSHLTANETPCLQGWRKTSKLEEPHFEGWRKTSQWEAWYSGEFRSALFRNFADHISVFLPERDYIRSGLCYRNSVCLLSVCNVGVPYSADWTFRQYFFTAVYAGHPLTSLRNFTEIVPGEPLHRGH